MKMEKCSPEERRTEIRLSSSPSPRPPASTSPPYSLLVLPLASPTPAGLSRPSLFLPPEPKGAMCSPSTPAPSLLTLILPFPFLSLTCRFFTLFTSPLLLLLISPCVVLTVFFPPLSHNVLLSSFNVLRAFPFLAHTFSSLHTAPRSSPQLSVVWWRVEWNGGVGRRSVSVCFCVPHCTSPILLFANTQAHTFPLPAIQTRASFPLSGSSLCVISAPERPSLLVCRVCRCALDLDDNPCPQLRTRVNHDCHSGKNQREGGGKGVWEKAAGDHMKKSEKRRRRNQRGEGHL